MYSSLQDQAVIGERLGHINLVRKGFFHEGKLKPEKYLLSKDELQAAGRVLGTMPEVKLVSPRLKVNGLISNGRNSAIFLGEGVRPADMRIIRGPRYANLPGMLNPAKPEGAGVSSELAGLLGLRKGDSAILLASTQDGMANALEAEVDETFDTGLSATNDKYVLFPFEFAQRLYDTEGAERLVLVLQDAAQVPQVLQAMEARRAEFGFDFETRTWTELSVFYQQVKSMFGMIFFFLFTIVLVVVVMSIANTMGMTVLERTREIGTLRSLGMKRRSIMALFSVEGGLLAALGCLIGLAIFVLVAAAINFFHVTYTPPNSSAAIPLVIALKVGDLAGSFLFLAALATASAMLPARRAARMEIVDAFGHV
jgi:putative ABC transport system permease protein